MARVAEGEAAGREDPDPRRHHPPRHDGRAPAGGGGPDRAATRTSWAARTSSPVRTAASPRRRTSSACIRTSCGPSSRHWPKAPGWPPASSGAQLRSPQSPGGSERPFWLPAARRLRRLLGGRPEYLSYGILITPYLPALQPYKSYKRIQIDNMGSRGQDAGPCNEALLTTPCPSARSSPKRSFAFAK